jgi:hypothetical protein
MIKAVGRTLALDYIGIGLLIAVAAIGFESLRESWNRRRGALLAGFALLICGIGIYLPIGNLAPRYAVPAAWGAAIGLAALLTALQDVSKPWARRAAVAAIAGGLLAAMVANLGRQDKTDARIKMLWQALECVREQAPANAYVGWWTGPELELSEGYHFRGHLQQHGRADLSMPLETNPGCAGAAEVAISGTAIAPGDDWRILQTCATSYWFGRRQFRCYVWHRDWSRMTREVSQQSTAVR